MRHLSRAARNSATGLTQCFRCSRQGCVAIVPVLRLCMVAPYISIRSGFRQSCTSFTRSVWYRRVVQHSFALINTRCTVCMRESMGPWVNLHAASDTSVDLSSNALVIVMNGEVEEPNSLSNRDHTVSRLGMFQPYGIQESIALQCILTRHAPTSRAPQSASKTVKDWLKSP